MSWTMKGFLILLLFITIFKFVSNSNTGRTRIIEASDTNNSIESIYTSFNNSINSISNNTITHKTEFDTDLNHLVVDRNTGRVSSLNRFHWIKISMLNYYSVNVLHRLNFICLFVSSFSRSVSFRHWQKVFIGGRNRLYQLSPDLDIVATAKTGPRNDSKDCSFSECTQNLTRKLTDNINKVLLIDYSTSRLITCGSLFQGICSVRSLQNISSPEQDVVEAIVANSESKCYCEKRE